MNSELIKVHFESIDSTNSRAKSIILESVGINHAGKTSYGDTLPLLVTADGQSAGRGRYGRSFYSPEGCGVYMSYAYEYAYTEEELLGITKRVAELILPVLQAHTEKTLQIKPINDIITDKGKKLAGILTERVDYPDMSGRYAIIIGIGINCTDFSIPSDLLDTDGNPLSQAVDFLEPDCGRDQLISEICEALKQLHS